MPPARPAARAEPLPPPEDPEIEARLTPPRGGWPIRVTTASRFGRGVVTTRAVRAGELLEVAPLLVLPRRAEGPLSRWGYVFDTGTRSVVASGVVSFANHSYEPNARYDLDDDDEVIELSALVDLPAGAEVLVNYNGDPDGDGPLWFDVS